MQLVEFIASLVQIVSAIAGFVFSIWPFLVLSALQRKGNAVRVMLRGWVFAGILGGLSLLGPGHYRSWLIPEPLNSALFALTGLVLGSLVFAPGYLKRNHLRAKTDVATSVEDLQLLSPPDFENLVVEVHVALGHKAHRTGAIGDHGVDVVVDAKNGEKWIVQCKRWRGAVGEPIVRDFYGTMHHEKADQGAIITAGTFTPQARSWAKGKPITLVDGSEFMNLLRKTRRLAKSDTSGSASVP